MMLVVFWHLTSCVTPDISDPFSAQYFNLLFTPIYLKQLKGSDLKEMV